MLQHLLKENTDDLAQKVNEELLAINKQLGMSQEGIVRVILHAIGIMKTLPILASDAPEEIRREIAVMILKEMRGIIGTTVSIADNKPYFHGKMNEEYQQRMEAIRPLVDRVMAHVEPGANQSLNG